MKRIAILVAVCGCALACRPKAGTTHPRDAGECSLAQFNEEKGAVEVCQAECGAGIGESCGALATMLERGHLFEASHGQALELADKACGLGDALACLFAGDVRTEFDDLNARAEGYATPRTRSSRSPRRRRRRTRCRPAS